MSLSGIIHHSHSFTRLEIYHHIYSSKFTSLKNKTLFSRVIGNKTFLAMAAIELSGTKWWLYACGPQFIPKTLPWKSNLKTSTKKGKEAA